ncbi:MAG TPA: hypothetical protein VFB33_14230 [Candidatus Binataceae bacterium]|nr:hypothetical protein [Candidatus Binataceae bacterium]
MIGKIRRLRALVAALVGIGSFTWCGLVRAQTAPPPPAPPSLTRPSVPLLPGAPQPLVSVPFAQPTPLATPVPIPTPLPAPVARIFNCSCFTTASGTQWAGTVQAPDFATARQAASGACVAYVTSRTPASEQIQPPQTTQPATGATGALLVGPLGQAQPKPPLQQLEALPALTGQTICNVCACD